jgi:phosphate transport system permease protein
MAASSAALPRRMLTRSGRRGINRGDRAFEASAAVLGAVVVILLLAIVALLCFDARESISRFGYRFVTGSVWDPVRELFGVLPYVFGTIVTSALALLIAAPVTIGAALFLVEYAPTHLQAPIAFIIELLAVIPSIIYGLWGFFVLAPLMRSWIEPTLQTWLGPVPVVGALFGGAILGQDILIAGVILSIMIVPTVMSVSREILRAVPDTQREGMLALGATRWETVRFAVLPYARGGIVGAAMLGLARALGETMAVTMVIGNSSTNITASLFTPGYTMASAIANQFNEADKAVYFSAIVEIALILLLVSTAANLLARLLVWSTTGNTAAVRA